MTKSRKTTGKNIDSLKAKISGQPTDPIEVVHPMGAIEPMGIVAPMGLIDFLRQDELDYESAAKKFGEAAIPFLESLIESEDENIAVKATYLVGFIEGDSSTEVLQRAAEFGNSPIRVAAAYGAQKKTGKGAENILRRSLEDHDPSVVKYALKSVESLKIQQPLKLALDKIAKNFIEPEIKEMAKKSLKKAK